MSVKGSWSRVTNKESYATNYDLIFSKHKYDFDRTSRATLKGKEYSFDVYKCKLCNKLYIIDKTTGKRLKKLEKHIEH